MSAEFFDAIKAGNFPEVQRLLSLNPELIRAKENNISPIMVAAYHQRMDIADFIAEKTVALDIFESSALGRATQILRILARDPELVNAYSEDGFQPLGLACAFGQLDTVKFLVKAGAMLNNPSKNNQQVTPLQSAVRANQNIAAKFLLEKGADPNSRDQNGYTPLHAAAKNGDTDLIRALLFNGADMNAQTNEGKIPLNLADEAGQVEAAKLLKEGITRRFRGARLRSA